MPFSLISSTMLGYSQVVRQGSLTPSFVRSSRTIPTKSTNAPFWTGYLFYWGRIDELLFRGETLLVRENYNLAANVPLTAIPNRESRGTRPPCESRAAPSSPSGATLRTECGYSARLRAVKRQKSAKGVWGKTRVFPHKQHITSSRDYPPKQSGGLFRKYTTPLNYSLSK